MNLWDDFPTWENLCARFPDISEVKYEMVKLGKMKQGDQINKLLDPALPGSLEVFLKAAGVKASTYEFLRIRYSEQGVRHGLLTLLGIGKGRNNLQLPVGSVMCKYSDLHRKEMQDPEFLQAIKDSVNTARDATGKVNRGFIGKQVQWRGKEEIYKKALDYHFGFNRYPESFEDQRTAHLSTIKLNYQSLFNALSSGFRIAAQHWEEIDEKRFGYVKQVNRERADNFLPSPNKTRATDHYDYGSIHIDYNLFHFKKSRRNRYFLACVIIHEASHKWCRTQDNSYVHDASYKRQTPDLKVENADSYAFFAMSVYSGKLIKEDDDDYFRSR